MKPSEVREKIAEDRELRASRYLAWDRHVPDQQVWYAKFQRMRHDITQQEVADEMGGRSDITVRFIEVYVPVSEYVRAEYLDAVKTLVEKRGGAFTPPQVRKVGKHREALAVAVANWIIRHNTNESYQKALRLVIAMGKAKVDEMKRGSDHG